jgi:hypothetical protein
VSAFGDLRLPFDDSIFDRYDVVESLMTGPTAIAYDGIAIYTTEAVKPDELWAVSGNWRDMLIVKQELPVSRALWEGLHAPSARPRHAYREASAARARGARVRVGDARYGDRN